MRVFAIITIALTALGMLIGFIMLVSGSGAEELVGTPALRAGNGLVRYGGRLRGHRRVLFREQALADVGQSDHCT